MGIRKPTANSKAQSGFMAVMKKELKRFFTDRRMVLTTILFPGLMIYLLYTVMGSALSSFTTVDEGYVPQVYAVGLPGSLEPLTGSAGLEFQAIDEGQVDAIKESIQNKEADLLLVFSPGFADLVADRLAGKTDALGTTPPSVELYFNSTRTESSNAYGTMAGILGAYKDASFPLFTVNAGDQTFDLASERDTAGFLFSSLLPMLMMLFLFSGSMAVAPESISGEKERGTIATMLVTPLKRWELALGKVVSISCIALLGGMSSFIGIMMSLPNLLGSLPEGANATLYSFGDYALLLLVILSTVLVFIGFISIISAWAKTVKEAGSLVMPLMILVMLVGAMAMFSQSAQQGLLFYLIPVYNSVQCMVGIFSFTSAPLAVAVTIGVNLLVSAACVFVLTKMLSSEKVIFAR
ncbi:MAG: ABC transporter permease subunit [Coriobacteriaceae bacterium]|jgi:sodium transport system permease protein|nr:ABC transporter permease subunit [Coriobacteriaceae bacterium]